MSYNLPPQLCNCILSEKSHDKCNKQNPHVNTNGRVLLVSCVCAYTVVDVTSPPHGYIYYILWHKNFTVWQKTVHIRESLIQPIFYGSMDLRIYYTEAWNIKT